MYLQYIKDAQIGQFLNSLDGNITNPTIKRDVTDDTIIAFSNASHSAFHISDFECIDIKSGKIYSKQLRKFMIEQLDNMHFSQLSDEFESIDGFTMGDKYINSLHDYLIQDTCYDCML